MSIFNSRTSGLRERMQNKVINNAKNSREMICIDNIKQRAHVSIPQAYYI